MPMENKITKVALIPAFEPEEILLKLVPELVKSGFEVVVVNDGSGPAYGPIFEMLKEIACVISYDTNHGKGYALKRGLKYIYENKSPAVVVTMDADGQHLVSDAQRLCDKIQKSKADLLIGSRILPRDAPIKSRLGNGITRLIYRTITGVSVYDTQSGLRAFKSDRIPFMLDIKGDRYEYEMNVLLTMAKQKKDIEEIPIKTIYFDKQNSVSHFDAVKDSFKIYREILKFTGSSLFSFLVDYSLYSLILLFLGSRFLLTANIGARAISSCVNFGINKKLVFQTNGDFKGQAVKYFSLVIFILCVNSILLTILTSLGINAFLAKILTECIMFFFSYTIQSCLIFRKGK